MNALKIVGNGNYGSTSGTSGALLVDCSGGSGECVQFYTNAGSQAAITGVVNIVANNTQWDQPSLYIVAPSTLFPASTIRIDAGIPTLTMVDTTKTAPAGKFQFTDHNDTWRFEGRAADNSRFETIFVINRTTSPGRMYIGDTLDSTKVAVSTLDVSGNLAVGIGYAGTTAAPDNGAIIKGNVGIGLTNPTHQLELASDSAAKPTSNTWTVVSDRRVKKDVRPFEDGVDVIRKIEPVRYRLNGKAGLPKDAEGIGILAEDIQKIAPYTVGVWKAKLEATDKNATSLLEFNSGPLTFVLINAIKEQQKEIEALRGRIELLEGKK
ncbi:MAG: tail fiber domain-containing protein [Elusimicrobia bacterium]|nr:tail fiber domain-containing protein [Elusimicrobiota bacterium]